MIKYIKSIINKTPRFKNQILRTKARILKQPVRYLEKARGVVHVGANTGQERDLYAVYNLDVIWIEPIPRIFEKLEENLLPYPKQQAIQALVADSIGKEFELRVASNDGASSSIFDFKDHSVLWPEVYFEEVIHLKSKTLSSIFEEYILDINAYNFLVLDVQGAEMLVLMGAEAILDQIEFIQAEAADFKMYDGEAGIRELIEYLDGKGFSEIARHRLAGDGVGNNCYEIFFRNKKNRK
jgi:FkbM family methyltransferase